MDTIENSFIPNVPIRFEGVKTRPEPYYCRRVSNVPVELVALTRDRGLRFSPLYLGQGESPPHESVNERERMSERSSKVRRLSGVLCLLRRVLQFLGKIPRSDKTSVEGPQIRNDS